MPVDERRAAGIPPLHAELRGLPPARLAARVAITRRAIAGSPE